ncbi:MAG: zinc ribbon domain-containing protein [Phormidium sp.]|jgi:hypothetical protein
MSSCPRCQQPVRHDDVSCPHCGYQLKAFGHPGIPLYRANPEEPLCLTCTYHLDDSCNFPKRPHAQTCTLYQNIDEPILTPPPRRQPAPWYRRNPTLVGVLGLLAISLILALAN